MFLLVASLLVAFLYFYDVPKNPVGFFVDEASIAYNAHTIATEWRDEYGARFPLYFSSFLDYKSPILVYGLAGVFRVTVRTTRYNSQGYPLVSSELLDDGFPTQTAARKFVRETYKGEAVDIATK